MNHTPALINHCYAQRHRLRKWLWLALGLLLLGSVLQLGHNHQAHKSTQDPHQCVICQHSQLLDKILPPCITLVAALLLVLSLAPALVAQLHRQAPQHTQIRAPPTQLHR